MLFFVLGVIVWVLVGVLWNVYVRMQLYVNGSLFRLEILLKAFYKSVPLRLVLHGDLRSSADIPLAVRYSFIKHGKKKEGRQSRRKDALPSDCLRVRSIGLWGELGAADAAKTALLVGGLRMAATMAAGIGGPDCMVDVQPNFCKAGCRLKLESIAEVRTAQVIRAVIRQKILSVRRRKAHAASNRKHHANLHGTA